MRVLRRVRRVALSGKGAPSLGRLMSSHVWDPTAASISRIGGALSVGDTPFRQADEALVTARLNRRTALWDRIFRRRLRRGPMTPGLRGAEPVWINKQADAARARDALRVREMFSKDGEERTRGLRRDSRAFEQSQKDEDCWSPGWETGGWKLGKGKAKWARQA